MDERGIDDALIESNAVIRDNLAEGPNQQFPTSRFCWVQGSWFEVQILGFRHMEICGLATHVLALVGVAHQKAIELMGAVAGGDDDGKSKGFTKRFQRVDAECSQILYCFSRRRVVESVVARRLADDKLSELEVRCELNVVYFL